jgi:hypothetical protein
MKPKSFLSVSVLLSVIMGSFLFCCAGKKPWRPQYVNEFPPSVEVVTGNNEPVHTDASVVDRPSSGVPDTVSSPDVPLPGPEPTAPEPVYVPDAAPPVPDTHVTPTERPPVMPDAIPDTPVADAGQTEPVPEKVPEPSRPFHPFYDLDPRKGQVGVSNASLLKVHNGNIAATKDGQVVENLIIYGSVYVQANRVTIRNCKIILGTKAVSAISVRAIGGKKINGLRVEHTEISGGLVGVSLATQTVQTFGGAAANQFSHVYMHGVGDGVLGNHFTLYRSRIETVVKPWGQNHSDGIQVFQEGQVKLVESYIDAGVDDRSNGLANAAVFIGQDYLPDITNVHIDNCYLNGGGHIYRHWEAKKNLGKRRPTKCSIINSWFGRNSIWDPAVSYVGTDGSPVWKNNRFVDNNNPVSLVRR